MRDPARDRASKLRATKQAPSLGRLQKWIRPIGQLLLLEGLITEQQLNQALALQAGNGGRLVHQLIALGHLTAHDFVFFLARQPGITSIDLSQCRIEPEVAALIPRDFAIERQLCPIDHLGRLLTVGMVCPLDRQSIFDLHRITGLSVKPMLSTADAILSAIRECYPKDPEIGLSRSNSRGQSMLQWIR